MRWLIWGLIAGIVVALWLSRSFATPTQANNDLLETTFSRAKSFNYIVNVGNSRDSVGRSVLRQGYNIFWRNMQDPIFVRVIKRFLGVVVILWVPFLLFGAIKYIVAAGDEWAQKQARSWMINVVVGIVLALLSLTIVTFVSSILNDGKLWQDFSEITPP